jgi:short-subunit dehydrogenase
MQNLIITGASGALGMVVTSHFLSRDYKVIAVVRDEKGKQNLPVHHNLQPETLDRTSGNKSL